MKKPTRQRNTLYPFSRLLIRGFAHLMLRFHVKHRAPLPLGPKVFVANHPSATDPFLIHLVSQEELNVMITEKAFQVPGFGWFLRTVREIPVPLSLEGGVAAIEQARQHLAQGRSVAIFIEGLISPEDGSFHRPRAGASHLVLGSDIPVIPVGIYLRRNWRLQIKAGITGEQTEAYWYIHGPYVITVGEPMYFQQPCDPRAVRAATTRIMDAVIDLATESEQRGAHWMPRSLLVQFARWLKPLWQRNTASML